MTDIDSDDVRFKKMRPLISYYGGKQRMASKIVPLLPEHTVYVEPFAGGAAVLFAKPWPKVSNTQHYREVINDTNEDLINMYRQAHLCPQDFYHRISMTMYSRKEHENSKKILKSIDASPAERAWAYYVKIQQSFANVIHGGWGTGTYSRNLATTWGARDVNLRLKRFQGVHIECDDAVNVIKRWDSPQTLFYCDPPYVNTDCGPYKGFGLDDYNRLLTTLNRCTGAVVLSSYKIFDVAVPSDWQIFTFKSQCSASGLGKTKEGRNKSRKAEKLELGVRSREEVVYRRFNTKPWRPELEKLRQAGVYSCFARNPKEVGAPGFNPPRSAPNRASWEQAGMNF